jgi:hypothetical protein
MHLKGGAMTNQLNLKELERKAFRSTYQDGLWDLYLGLLVMCMAVFVYRPESGYSPLNIIMEVCAFGIAGALFLVGKKLITLPRMGQVVFGPARKRKKTTLAIILGAVVVVQAGFILLSFSSWLNPEWGARINSFLHDANMERLAVAAVGSLFVGPSMILIAYFNDFLRGYYIAIMFTLAVFLMILLNQPIYPIIIGFLVVIPGVVLLVRFLKKYPLPREEAPHE